MIKRMFKNIYKLIKYIKIYNHTKICKIKLASF